MPLPAALQQGKQDLWNEIMFNGALDSCCLWSFVFKKEFSTAKYAKLSNITTYTTVHTHLMHYKLLLSSTMWLDEDFNEEEGSREKA